MKLLIKKGHKSRALRMLGVLQLIGWSLLFGAYFMNENFAETNKISYKAAGVKYKEQHTVAEIISLSGLPTVKEQRKSMVPSISMRIEENYNSINENKSIIRLEEDKQPTNLELTKIVRQSVALKSKEISSDLKILSSFDCVKSIPTVLLDYISNTFLSEYGRSHEDFHIQYTLDETLPLLKEFNVNCGVDQNCSTSFQYDKQYGVSTTGDKMYVRNDIFYCCPSVHSLTNQTISNVCKRAQALVGKSIFRESKNSTFLE